VTAANAMSTISYLQRATERIAYLEHCPTSVTPRQPGIVYLPSLLSTHDGWVH